MTVKVLHTGGSISNLQNSLHDLPIPEDLPALQERKIMNKFSENMRPDDWSIIARHVRDASKDCSGIVVTHGTDTMAYTINAVDLMVELNVPVVFTGALLPPDHGQSRARTTMAHVLQFADYYDNPGVFLSFPGYEVNVTKVLYGPKTRGMQTYSRSFYSQDQKSVATIKEGEITIKNNHQQGSVQGGLHKLRGDSPVQLVTIHPAIHPNVIQEAVSTAPIVILDLYNSGTAPNDPMLLQALREAGETIVAASIPYEQSKHPYSSTKALQKAGVEIFEKITRERLLVGATMALTTPNDALEYLDELFRP